MRHHFEVESGLSDDDIASLTELLSRLVLDRLIERLDRLETQMSAATDALTAAVTQLGTDVDALIALQQAADQTPAVEAATAAVQAVDAKVTAITAPPATATAG